MPPSEFLSFLFILCHWYHFPYEQPGPSGSNLVLFSNQGAIGDGDPTIFLQILIQVINLTHSPKPHIKIPGRPEGLPSEPARE